MGAFWGSLAAIGIGMTDLYGRRIINVAGPVTAALIMQIIGMLTALVSLLFFASVFASSDLLWGALSGIGMAGGLGFYYRGLQRSSSTIAAPVVATLTAVIPYVYSIVRGAEVSALAVVGAGVALVGLVLIAANNADATARSEGLLWGALSGVSYGFSLSVLVEVTETAGVWPAVSQRFVATLVLGIVALATKSLLVPPGGQRVNGLNAGIFAGLSSVFALKGLAVSAPQTVVTISMSPVVSVIIGFVAFSDAVTRRQIAGIALVLLGVAGVVAF